MPDPVTLVYKTIYAPNSGSEGDTSAVLLHLDVYLPTFHSSGTSASGRDDTEIPAVVYFHGGGLLVGNRRSWFPDWLHGKHCAPSLDPSLLGLTAATRTSIHTRCSVPFGRLSTPFTLHGTRYP